MSHSRIRNRSRSACDNDYQVDLAAVANHSAREHRCNDRSLVSNATQRSRTSQFMTVQPNRTAECPTMGSRQTNDETAGSMDDDFDQIYRDPEHMTSWIGDFPTGDQYGVLDDQYTRQQASRQAVSYHRNGAHLGRSADVSYTNCPLQLETLNGYSQDVTSDSRINEVPETPTVSTIYPRNVIPFPTNGGHRSQSSMRKHAIARYMHDAEDYAPSHFISNGGRPRDSY